LPFLDKRYRHRDLAAKFLWLTYTDRIVGTKKNDLDSFVMSFKTLQAEGNQLASEKSLDSLRQKVNGLLDNMNLVFTKGDPLLQQVGMVTVFFHLLRMVNKNQVSPLERSMFVAFDKARKDNKAAAEANNGLADLALLEFDGFSQTINDGYAIARRLIIMLDWLQKNSNVRYDKNALDYGIVHRTPLT
ncbi:MAG: hypothetical protein AAB502_11480, partial [Chloroflexota bacterium]